MAVEKEEAPIGRKEVVGLFGDKFQAERAIAALSQAGFDDAELGYLAPGEDTEPAYFRRAGGGLLVGLVAGAVLGAILGAVVSWLLPVARNAISGGIVLAIVMGAITGGATGAVAGLLFGAASSRDQGVYYSQEVRRGRTLVTVRPAPERVAAARSILLSHGAMEAAPMRPAAS